MEINIGGNKKAAQSFGFEDIALVPAVKSIDPDDIDLSWQIGEIKFELPVIASAMDAVVDVDSAIILSKLGCLPVLNLEGLSTRYTNYKEIINKIIAVSGKNIIPFIQKVYQEPIKERLIEKRIRQIKEKGVVLAVSSTPAKSEKMAEIAVKSGADIFVIQSTVTTADYISSKKGNILSIKKFCQNLPLPVIVGNCVDYEGALSLMETGAVGVLVGVGPGAACTTRQVLGIGVPQVTAIAQAAAAREDYYKKTKKYVLVIADGGMRVGGDVAKAIASGADVVMLGSPLAQAKESPGKGYHWGMATFHPGLPRGTRIKVGIKGSLKEILLGPAKSDDGTMNLLGALRIAMGICGARNLKEMQDAKIVIASSFQTEGKTVQRAQRVGMGK